jgi:hypothetical protein
MSAPGLLTRTERFPGHSWCGAKTVKGSKRMKYFSSIHFVLFVLLILLTAFNWYGKANDPDNVLIQLLKSNPELFGNILENAEKYKLQILYTQIDRDKNNNPRFTSYSYRLNKTDYFYPASTVKLPAAILALEKLNNLHITGLNKYTSLKIDSAFSHQTGVNTDSTSENNLPSIAHFIKKIFLVSDNDAYNRLYEFLGQQYLNETLQKKGFGDAKIIRRLETAMTPEENRVTNPFTFYNKDSILYQQPLTKSEIFYKVEMKNVQQGIGYIKGDSLINQPIDFSFSNYISIESLQRVLKAVFFPEALPEKQKFNLTEDDYHFLYKYMSMLPRESTYPAYHDTSEYQDNYVKYFMSGDSGKNIPGHIRIFSKSGQAYGYLIDNAYIVDFEKKIEFLLTAVIQVNENQIYNDDTYEYEEVGIPFLANLGKVIYQFEITRGKKFKPDLSKFKVN